VAWVVAAGLTRLLEWYREAQILTALKQVETGGRRRLAPAPVFLFKFEIVLAYVRTLGAGNSLDTIRASAAFVDSHRQESESEFMLTGTYGNIVDPEFSLTYKK
jgi:hypothetical protein